MILWDFATGQKLGVVSAHSGAVNGIAIFPDGTRLVTAGDDYKVKIWDLSYGRINRQPLQVMDHPGVVTSAALSPDGARLVTGVQDGTARIWDVATGRAINVLRGHTDMVSAVAFDPLGKHVGTAGLDGTAKIWDAASGKELLTLNGHNSPVTSIAFSPDGKRVATTGRDGTAKLWDATTGQELVTFTSNDGSVLNDVAFSPDGTRLAVGGDKGVRVFLLKIGDLMALARTRLTRSLTGDECQKYLHQEKAECQASAAIPTTTPIPPTGQGRVCQVTNTGGLYDRSFNEAIFNGLQDSSKRFGWDAKVLQSSSTADFERNVREFIRADCDLIVGVMNMADAIQSAAAANPDQKFQIMDYVYDQPLENVRMQVFATDQAAFLAGYAAASVTRTGKVGTFGGIDIPPVTDFMDGFALGVQYYNKVNGTDVEVLGWDPQRHDGLFVGSFCCAAEGREITKKLLDSGADVILPVAGTNIGPGAEYAVKEHGSSYIIGVDTDWAIRDPNYANIILTSIVKNYDTSVLEAVQAIEDGTFSGGIHSGTLATGEVSLAPFHALDPIVSDKVKTDLEQIKQKIADGEINTKP